MEPQHISNQLQKVSSQEPAKQGLLPQKSTEPEEKFLQAIEHGKPIKLCPMEQLKEVLRLNFIKVGLRAANFPKGEEKEVLHRHILSNYGGHTAREIVLAFEMGMQGRLENLKGEVLDMNHYENFSCLYFSNVMNAYREWAKTVASQHEKNFSKTLKDNVKDASPGENMSDQTYQEWFESTCVDYKSGKIKSLEFLPPMIAEWLISKGTIDHKLYFKPAAIMIGKRLAAECEQDKIKRMDYHDFKQQYENAVKNGEPFTGQWPAQIERLAKQLALSNHILQEEKTNEPS